MVTVGDYVRIGSVDELLALLKASSDPVQLIAGGTDLLTRLEPDSAQRVLLADIGDIDELAGLVTTDEGLRIGAATKLADIEGSELLTGILSVLADGAAQVGSPQIRHLATIGGNVCNASPAADTVPPLLILDAQAELVSPRGLRTIPLDQFFVGPGQTVVHEDEFLAALFVPTPPEGAVAAYTKQSSRRAMDLAVVGVGALLAWTGDRLEARIALGAVAPTPLRARQAEQLLLEADQLDGEVIAEAARLAAQEARPISDVRASAEYRAAMVQALAERALHRLAARLAQPPGDSR
jgi:CO/xanthine dehydrogenase FAD-binding subunit